MANYAYVRVSTREQNIDRQLAALEPYNIPKQNIFCDYQSGKDFDRPAYRKMLKRLKAGDLLIIKSIDRLGRNYKDTLVEWQNITKTIGADILVLDMDRHEAEGGRSGRHADRGSGPAGDGLLCPDRAGGHPSAAG